MSNSYDKTSITIGKKQYQLLTPKVDFSELYVVQLREHIVFDR